MTEQTLSTPIDDDASEALPVDFDLDDWINGGTVTQRSVPIYARPDLMADIEEWQRRRSLAEERAKAAGGDATLGERDELADLDAEGEKIHSAWRASKAEWRVRALDPAELDEITAGTPQYRDLPGFTEPEPPAPRDRAGSQPSAAYTVAHSAWEARKAAHLANQADAQADLDKKRAAASDDANLQMIAAAVIEVRFANGNVADSVTVAQLRDIRTKIGPLQVLKLLQAAQLATYKEPVLPVPSSRTSSGAARG